MGISPGAGLPRDYATIGGIASLQAGKQRQIDHDNAQLRPSQNIFVSGIQRLVGGIFRDIFAAFRGTYTGPDEHLRGFQDGQLALRGRTDLLDPLLNYGSVYAPKYSGSDAANTWHRVNFTRQISTEMRGCEVLPAGGIKLLTAGCWDIRAHVMTGGAWGLLPRHVRVEARVYRPDGRLFSTLQGRISGHDRQSIPVISSVQVPEAGYEVQVWLYSENYYTSWGYGPAYSRLTVQQVSSATVPRGNEESGIEDVNSA